jgi:two-component system response regulator WspF
MRIAIVNDLASATEAMRRVIVATGRHEIAWTAADGAEAVRLCARDRPDLVLMDLIMPVMDGVEATRRIMVATPCAILVVTADVAGTSGRVFDALGAGALDAVNTPMLAGPDREDGARALLGKIEMLGRLIGASAEPASRSRPPFAPPGAQGGGRWLFAIGASAGGPAALTEVLKGFPKNTAAAFVVVQHLDEHFAPGLADWLGQQIALPVRLAREGDVPERGVVLLPGRGDHLVLTRLGTLAYTADPVAYAYRPSVDALFESVVAHWHGQAVGVLLTGMGRDGARGLKKMREARFSTIAQDRASSAVYGMPKAAAELDAAVQILPLTLIGPALRQLL